MIAQTARQIQIIEESLALIAEQGMEGLTYRNLSERFGMSIPAFYRHFASKAEVLLGIIDYLNVISLDVYETAQETGSDPLDRLRLVLMGYAKQFSDNGALAALLFPDAIGGDKRELHESVLEHMGENRTRLTGLLADGIDAGLVRADVSAERWAFVVMGSLRLEVTQWRLDGRRTDLVKRVASLWNDLEKILRPPLGTADKQP
ncbi:MAG: TetR/AcrR family transcriptional regulator [Thermoleophilia bacterium]|nr:TetR/AcrR family transcriptional regulator [Thermoleophilia bacterium]